MLQHARPHRSSGMVPRASRCASLSQAADPCLVWSPRDGTRAPDFSCAFRHVGRLGVGLEHQRCLFEPLVAPAAFGGCGSLRVYTLTDIGLRALGQVPRLNRLCLRNLGSDVTNAGSNNLATCRSRRRSRDMRWPTRRRDWHPFVMPRSQSPAGSWHVQLHWEVCLFS